MPTLDEAVREFLSSGSIAVAGVSHESNQPANAIYRKLKSIGRSVTATNPTLDSVEGDRCYPDLRSIPGGVDAVLIATRPEVAPSIVRECIDLGIRRVWMHRSFGQGSVSSEATQLCHENGIAVIAGACPMMYCRPVDFPHRCMRTILGWVGRLPRVS